MHIPKGFLFSGISAGIKKSGKKDLGLVIGQGPLDAICYFTDNSFKAAPLLDSIAKIKKTDSTIQAIIVNSGNANCFTGKRGLSDVKKECRALAKILGIREDFIHVSSTGIIKKRLPVIKIVTAIERLAVALGAGKLNDFSCAIMTTDTFAKIESAQVKIGTKTVTICGVAKGAGMIWPQVKPQATMLSYIFTDADIDKKILRKISAELVERSFNSVTIDGCTSTNDSVFILASGRAGNLRIKKEDKACAIFKQALGKVCLELAKKIARDGEGATKLVEITVKGAKDKVQAKQAGLAIANSFLFKTAVYGANKNIGRIAQALGQAHIIGGVDDISIWCNDLKSKNVRFVVDLKKGKGSWTVYTCDISEKYVKINAEYN